MPGKRKQFDIEAGGRLREAREALHVRATDFAKAIGVTKQRLANWESGINGARPEDLVVVWRQYQISLDWVYLGLKGNLQPKLADELRKPRLVPPTAEKGRRAASGR